MENPKTHRKCRDQLCCENISEKSSVIGQNYFDPPPRDFSLTPLPGVSPANYYCASCDYTTSYKNDFLNHLMTRKHKKHGKETDAAEIKNMTINAAFECTACEFSTIKQGDYDKHLKTTKHIRNMMSDDVNKKSTIVCKECNQEFKTRSGLWKHAKNCKTNKEIESIKMKLEMDSKTEIENLPEKAAKKPRQKTKKAVVEEDIEILDPIAPTTPTSVPMDIFMDYLKQNKEIQDMLVEQNKELQRKMFEQSQNFQNVLVEQTKEQNKILKDMANKPTTINHNINNNHFNLNVFLNETCKNALNIAEFINSIQLQVEDFEKTGKLGYVEGISRIFIDQLRNTAVERRPLHCTDIKRETVYIKNQDEWNKETDQKKIMTWAVKRVAQLNLNQLPNWKEQNPECLDYAHPKSEQGVYLSMTAMGGKNDDEDKRFNEKIIRNVLKEVIIDKTEQ
jgi:hypothetical protein